MGEQEQPAGGAAPRAEPAPAPGGPVTHLQTALERLAAIDVWGVEPATIVVLPTEREQE